jgi:leader peptidase (prepilin peptidase)/N-methyltransferase
MGGPVGAALFVGGLLVLGRDDLRTRTFSWGGLLLLFLGAGLRGLEDPPGHLLGGLVWGGAFGGLWLLGRRLWGPGALGDGDVLLAAGIGLGLGLGPAGTALVLGGLIGALWAAPRVLRGRGRETMPYGPPLIAGALLTVLFGG